MGVTISVPDKIQLAVLLFATSQIVTLVHHVAKLVAQGSHEAAQWAQLEEGEQDLFNARACFTKLVRTAYGPRDIFVAHFRRKFAETARLIHAAAENGEIRVVAEHFLSVENVLEAFREDDEPVLRYVWQIASGDRLFEDHAWRSYFEATTLMIRRHEIKWIRAILVVDSVAITKTPRVEALLGFFRWEKGLCCRLINDRDFKALCLESGVPGNYLDFGIYGTRLLFRTEQYTPSIVGVFSKQPATIRQYTEFFDRMWSSVSITQANPSKRSKLSLEELLAADEGEP
jgi:hypothetical protein